MEHFKLRDVDVDHPAMQVTMPLISVNDEEVRCIGTAFAVAPGLAITSEHIVDDWLTHQQHRDGYKRADARLSVHAIQFLPEGQCCRWIVESSYRSSAADIAFLQFTRPQWWGDGPNQIRPRNARLNFNPPHVGDEVRVFGFPASKVAGGGILQISPCECVSKVRDVHFKGDGAYRPLSYIDIEGEILPGMSGGPCFDREWNVLGVNAKGWQFQDNGPPLAYVALLWPAMSLDIDLFKTGAFPTIELFNKGPARALGYERIFVTSSKKVHFTKEAITELKRTPPVGTPEYLLGALEFARSNAQSALADVRILADQSITFRQPLDINAIHNGLRRYFWELEAALNISVNIIRQRLGLDLPLPVCWDDLVAAVRTRPLGPTMMDEVGLLNLAWYARDLFELRTFAGECRSGLLHCESAISHDGRVVALAIGPCIREGQQIFLPDGLNRFFESCGNFVRRLLTLTDHREKVETTEMTR